MDNHTFNMLSAKPSGEPEGPELLRQILMTVQSIEQNYTRLSAAIDSIQGQVSILSSVKQTKTLTIQDEQQLPLPKEASCSTKSEFTHHATEPMVSVHTQDLHTSIHSEDPSLARKRPVTVSGSRIILTTYPNQSGIDPLPLDWGNKDFFQRGPVVVSRNQSTIRRRNGKTPFALHQAAILIYT